MSDEVAADAVDAVVKVCKNPECPGGNPMKGDWCTGGKCKVHRKAFRAAQKAGAGVITGVAVAPHDDGTACWGIDSVHGQSDYPEHLSDVQLRNDPARIEKEVWYRIWGPFGKDEDDVGYGKRLRWVKLSELLENVGDDDLAKLRAWEKGLSPAMKQERKRLREEDE